MGSSEWVWEKLRGEASRQFLDFLHSGGIWCTVLGCSKILLVEALKFGEACKINCGYLKVSLILSKLQ